MKKRLVALGVLLCLVVGVGLLASCGGSDVLEGMEPGEDTVLTVSTADAERAAREVLFFDGVPACTSAGATLAAAVQLMNAGKSRRPLCVFAGRRTYE